MISLFAMYKRGTMLLSILWCSQDFLVIDWLCPKTNTLQEDIAIYYVPKWHMAMTVVCSQDTTRSRRILLQLRLATWSQS